MKIFNSDLPTAMKEYVKYRQDLLTDREFTVFSDHKPLENININSRTDGK